MTAKKWKYGFFTSWVEANGNLVLDAPGGYVSLKPSEVDPFIRSFGRALGWHMGRGVEMRQGTVNIRWRIPRDRTKDHIPVRAAFDMFSMWDEIVLNGNRIPTFFRWLCRQYDWVDA